MALPIVAASLLGGLINIAGSLVGRVMIALGISVITYTGLSVSLDFLKAEAVASFGGLPAQAIALLSFMKVGSCISIIFSAMLARVVQQGLTGDTLKKWVLK